MSYAFDSRAIETQANQTINALYHTANTQQFPSTAKRIEWFSAQFKEKPYLLGSLGEGPNARYDQFPRYRMDAFDCDTYVTTVLSLVQGHSLDSFRHNLSLIRYKNGKVSYISRNHFTSIDWNQNNQQRGLLKDITLDIQDKKGETVAQFAKALINKPSWYAHMTPSTIRLQQANPIEQNKRLDELKTKGKGLDSTLSKIPYIPLSALFINKEQPNLYLFSQIPSGAIIEIIRPNWDLREKTGTALNVSHLGFAIWINDTLYFRQASSQFNKVVDVPLIDYLKDALKSPTIKGINIQIVS
jgi:hypothetical protein